MLRASRVRREFLQPLPAGITPHAVEEGAAAQRALAELGGNSDPVAACYGDIAALSTPTLIADHVFHAACIRG